MKRILLVLMFLGIIIVSGCNKKENTEKTPKSIQIYQELSLTDEQNKQLVSIRENHRVKIEKIRKDIEKQRDTLLDVSGSKKYTDAQKKANQEKYKAAAAAMRTKLAEERASYDNDLINILDDDQKKIYQKYLKQREKEKIQRENTFKNH